MPRSVQTWRSSFSHAVYDARSKPARRLESTSEVSPGAAAFGCRPCSGLTSTQATSLRVRSTCSVCALPSSSV
jgi:hypothetical protein